MGQFQSMLPLVLKTKPRFNRASLMAKPKALKSYLSSFYIVDHLYTFIVPTELKTVIEKRVIWFIGLYLVKHY